MGLGLQKFREVMQKEDEAKRSAPQEKPQALQASPSDMDSSSCAKDEESFVASHLSAAARAAFPDWSALLVASSVLGMTIWVARNHAEAETLAKETGYPALVLDDVLRQMAATRTALLPCLISATVH